MKSLGARITSGQRRAREARMFAKALKSPRHPILAHLVPIRRCNLSCTYCNECDQVSKPVPLELVLERVDQLADLGTDAPSTTPGHHPPNS